MAMQKSTRLISLLVLLAIIAIVATFIIPAWKHHQTLSRMEQAIRVGEPAKLVVMEAATMRGGLSQLKPDDLKINPQATANAYVARVDISETGRITIVTRDTGALPDPTFLLTPLEAPKDSGGAPILWACDMLTGDPQWTPSSCTRPGNAPVAPAVTGSASPRPA